MSLITPFGLDQLKKHLAELKAELVRTFDERAAAAAEGDLKENSAYIFMTERANVLQTQIEKATQDLREAEVLTPPTQFGQVEIGHQIKLIFETDHQEMKITLVGKNDASLKPGWISADSPLGIAILGKIKSAKAEVNGQSVIILDILPGEVL